MVGVLCRRVAAALLQQTYFVPDEHWQGPEVLRTCVRLTVLFPAISVLFPTNFELFPAVFVLFPAMYHNERLVRLARLLLFFFFFTL